MRQEALERACDRIRRQYGDRMLGTGSNHSGRDAPAGFFSSGKLSGLTRQRPVHDQGQTLKPNRTRLSQIEVTDSISNKKPASNSACRFLVEHIGLEPMTSTLPVWHSSQLS